MKSTGKMTCTTVAVLLGLLVITAGTDAFAQGGLWESKAPMPTARSGATAGVIDGKLYVVGGQGTADQKLSTLEVYNPADNTWTAKASMPTARNGAGSGVINGKLYVAGGESSQKLTTLEVYDPATNAWATLKPMLNGRSTPGVVAIDGKLYVAGGCVGWCAPVTTAFEVYDPANNTWTTKASLPTGRGVASVEAVNGLFYVMGGCCGSVASQSDLMAKTIEAYNPTTNTWTAKTQHNAGAGATAGSIDGSIYVAKSDATEVYNPATDSWATLSPMLIARQYAAGGVINGKLYLAGGYTGSRVATLEAYTPATTVSFDAVQKIYIGYYQRPADPGGLIYWTNRLNASNGNLMEIIDAFANSPESQNLYGTITGSNIASVVNSIYLALFNRDADAAGRDWYVAEFNAGRFTAATIMLNVLNGAQNEDLQSINNKLTAANLFTRTIDPELDGSNLQVTYAGDGDVIAGRNFLTLYGTSVRVPTQAETTAYITANIANPGDPILGPAPPAAPSNPSTTSGNNQVTISWAAVVGATSYNIYWATTSGVTKTSGTKISGATSPYSHAGLTNGVTYYYVVTAANSYGESSESTQASATPVANNVGAVLQTTGPFGALMVGKGGDVLLPMVDRDASGNATKLTGALYLNNDTGNSVAVYVGDDGKPAKTVMGDYILLFSNWSADGTTADIAKIYTPTNYIEVFKRVRVKTASTVKNATSNVFPAVALRTCLPVCGSDMKTLAELLKLSGLLVSSGSCLVATTASLGAAALPCAGVVVSTATFVMGDEAWLGIQGMDAGFSAMGAAECIAGQVDSCVTTLLGVGSQVLDTYNKTLDDNQSSISFATPFLSDANQPSGVVQQGGGPPTVPSGEYECTPGGAMQYLACFPEGVRSCQSNYTWGSCTSSPVCTAFTYSAWSACQSDNTQTRTIISRSPDGCTGGTPGPLSQSCTPLTCNSFTYSAWSACQSTGTQTRTITSRGPDGCSGGTPGPLSQSCTLPSCTYTISPQSNSFLSSGGSGTVSVTAQDGCAWTAASGASWISVTSGSSGSGNGTVAFSVAANAGASLRSGTVTIAGQTYTATQEGSVNSCSDRAANCCTFSGGSQIQLIKVPVSCGHCPNENTTYAGYIENGYRFCDCDACPSW